MLRAVADPGVFVSALIGRESKAAPALLVDELLRGRWQLVASRLLREELSGVLLRPKFRRYASEAEVELFVVRLLERAEADALVSGDRHLTMLTRPPLPVLTPRAFLDLLN